MPKPFTLQLGHTAVLINGHGVHERYYVREILEDGWMFEPYADLGKRLYFSGVKIEHHYRLGLFRYEPWDDDSVASERRKRLRREFQSYPEPMRRKAIRRLRFVRETEACLREGMTKSAALTEGPRRALAQYGDAWEKEDDREAWHAFKTRTESGLVRPDEVYEAPPRFPPWGERMGWEWLRRYVEQGETVNALLDRHEEKGRRGSQLLPEVDEQLEIYFKDHIKRRGVFHFSTAYVDFSRILVGLKLPVLSRKAFKARVNKEFSKKGIAKLEKGQKTTRRLNIVSGFKVEPLWPNHHGEIDHTLIKMRVQDDETGIDVGTPWMTAARDRATGMITGLHMSMWSPSWATLSRALAHSIWPKDLTEYPDLKNDWPSQGLTDEMYTDRGMDMICDPGRAAAADLRFEILNEPGYSPWLRGGLENWNKIYKAEIMTFKDGVTAFKNPEFRGKNWPTVKYSELIAHTVKWLVDDHHVNGSDGQDSHLQRYRDGIAQHGPPAPVNIDKLRRLTMMRETRTIQNYGVELFGFFFVTEDPALLGDIKDRSPKNSFTILYDPWNIGSIELVFNGEYHTLWNRCGEAKGLTMYQSEYIWKAAGLAKRGENVTMGDFLREKERTDADLERVLNIGRKINRKRGSQITLGRYREVGRFFTPVPISSPRYREAPAELPGWFQSDGGILRPTFTPQTVPTITLTNASAKVIQMESAQLVAPKQAKTPKPQSKTSSVVSILDRLAAESRTRSAELGS